MKTKADFSDLTTRAISAVVMSIVAGYATIQGGAIFNALITVAAGLMTWEVSRMHDDTKGLSVLSGVIVSIVVFVTVFPIGLPPLALLSVQLMIAMLVSVAHNAKMLIVFSAVLVVIMATTALAGFRQFEGLTLTLWLLFCVIASDMGGYFAGKMIGGPKLWVRISPKKTWSGTIGGWALAFIVGLLFVLIADQTFWIAPISILVAIAAQSGDLAESALKRHAGIKDSSNLIPGHGGLLDRFDGVLGVCFLIFIAGITGIL